MVTSLNAPVAGQDIREYLLEVFQRHIDAVGYLAPTPKFIQLLNNTAWAPPELVLDCMREFILDFDKYRREADIFMWKNVSQLKGMTWPYFENMMKEQGFYDSYGIANTQYEIQQLILDLWDFESSDEPPPNMTPFPNEKALLDAARRKILEELDRQRTTENALEVLQRFCTLPGFSWDYFESILTESGFRQPQLKTIKRLKGKRLRVLGPAVELRSGWSADKAKRARQAVRDWTTEKYRSTQDFLRHGASLNSGANAHAASMANYFNRMVATAPHGSKPGIKYLYRGVHAGMADALERHGFLHDQGYLAFSWDKIVAERFAKRQLMIRLHLRDIPPGTPWIWFGAGSHPSSTASDEAEVLLPPGRLLTTQPDPAEPDVMPVKYVPFKR